MTFTKTLALSIASVFALSSMSFAATLTNTVDYTFSQVTSVPDTTNGFSGMTAGENGDMFVVGGYGLERGDVVRVDSAGVASIVGRIGSGYSNNLLSIVYKNGYVYTAGDNGIIHKMDVATGASSVFATVSGAVNGLEIVPGEAGASFTLAALDRLGQATWFNGDTGAAQASASGLGNYARMDVRADGSLLGASYYSPSAFFEFDETGTESTASSGLTGIEGLAVHYGTGNVYVMTTSEIWEFSADLSSRSLFASGLTGSGGWYPGGISFNDDFTSLYFAEQDGSGYQRMVINEISGFDAFSVAGPAPVPLPASALLLGGGLFVLRGMRKRA